MEISLSKLLEDTEVATVILLDSFYQFFYLNEGQTKELTYSNN